MENREVYLIPRNLNKDDIIIHKPISLSLKDLAYVVISTGSIAWAVQSDIPLIGKLAITVISGVIAIVGIGFRYEGSSIDETLLDIIGYKIKKMKFDSLNKSNDEIVKEEIKEEEKEDGFKFSWDEPKERTVSQQKTTVSIRFKSFVS